MITGLARPSVCLTICLTQSPNSKTSDRINKKWCEYSQGLELSDWYAIIST